MKKILLGLILSSSIFTACKKEEPPKPTPTPAPKPAGSKSYVRVTIKGKTLEARDTIVVPFSSTNFYPMLQKFEMVQNSFSSDLYDKTFGFNSLSGGTYYNGNMKIVVSGASYATKNLSQVDSFKTLTNSNKAFTIEDMSGEKKVIYSINRASTIYITKWADDVTEGKLNLMLTSVDGAQDTVKGEFKIYK